MNMFNFLLQNNIFTILIITLFSYFLIIKFWHKISNYKFFSKTYSGVQRAHKVNIEIPRLGGVIVYFGLFLCLWIPPESFDPFIFRWVIVAAIPLVLISIKEDLFHNTSPLHRLFGILISSLFILVWQDQGLPVITIPVIGELFNNQIFNIIFFTFALSSITNGMNLIDGVNGLASMVSIMILISLSFLAYLVGDEAIYQVCMVIGALLTTFMFFNYPRGKIFLGDTGAYLIGWLVGFLCIIFYARHPELPTWGAVLILFYPVMEMIFSVVRKLIFNQSPFNPDFNHLHSKLYTVINKLITKQNEANSYVMPSLLIIWLLPTLLIFWTYDNAILIGCSIILMIVLYLVFYFLLPLVKINR